MKSSGKIIEEYGGWIACFFGLVLSCIVSPEKYHYSELINGFPAIGLGIFGFMRTFIAIILQSSNKTIDYMKSHSVLFQCFIQYNKRVVYVSAILTLYAYFVPNVYILIQNTIVEYPNRYVKMAVISVFWGLFAKLCVDTFFFIRLFYILLKQ